MSKCLSAYGRAGAYYVPGDGHLVEVIRAACVHGHRRFGGAHTAGGAKRAGSIGGFDLV